jgi:hypothetical protein
LFLGFKKVKKINVSHTGQDPDLSLQDQNLEVVPAQDPGQGQGPSLDPNLVPDPSPDRDQNPDRVPAQVRDQEANPNLRFAPSLDLNPDPSLALNPDPSLARVLDQRADRRQSPDPEAVQDRNQVPEEAEAALNPEVDPIKLNLRFFLFLKFLTIHCKVESTENKLKMITCTHCLDCVYSRTNSLSF